MKITKLLIISRIATFYTKPLSAGRVLLFSTILSAWHFSAMAISVCATGVVSAPINYSCIFDSGDLTIQNTGSITPTTSSANAVISSASANALTNSGSITGGMGGNGSSGSSGGPGSNGTVGGAGVSNTTTITTLTNSGTLSGGNGGSGGSGGNGGSFGGPGGAGAVGGAGISNTTTITTLTNSGTLSGGIGGRGGSGGFGSMFSGPGGSGGAGAAGISNTATITTLTNTGTLSGGNGGNGGSGGPGAPGAPGGSGGAGINNTSMITTLTNSGTLSGGNGGNGGSGIFSGSRGDVGYGINNTGTITTLNNSQGGTSSSALTYRGTLPTNYNIIVNNPSLYGKLAVTGVAGTTAFGISSLSAGLSIVSGTPYTSILSGVPRANLVGGSTGLISSISNNYIYTLEESAANSGIWNLTVSAYSPGGGGSSGGSTSSTSTTTTTNINSGTSVGLSSIGVTANPVLAGGTIVLTKGERFGQVLTIQGTGSKIEAPTTGAAQLYGVLSGSGRLTFNGTGMTVLSAVNTYTGGTVVESGTLSLLGGTLGSGDVYVAPGAQLVGTGSIFGPMTVAGLFKPGNSPGYIGANASITMTSGSVYQQDIAGTIQSSASSPVGSTGYYSYLNITGGQFIISSGSTLIPALSNLFNTLESGYGSTPYTPVLGDRFRIITADGGISGKFSSVNQPAEMTAGTQFLPFYNMAGSNSLDLAVIPTSYKTTIATVSGNQNAQSVGSALDRMVVAAQSGSSSAAQDQLLYASSTQNAASLSGYAQSLAGEVYAAAVAVIAQTTQRVHQAVLTRLGDTMGLGLPNSMTSPAGNTGLMSTTNTALSGGVASSAISTNPNVNPNADVKTFSNGNVWGDLAYQYGNRNSDSNSGGWKSNLYQLVFGSDFFTANGMKIGGGLALSSTTLNPTYGSGTIQQGSLFAYGKMPVQDFVVDAMASFGLNSSDLSRGDDTGLTNGFKSKSISGHDAMVSLGVSRPFDTDNIRITPFARVTWQIVTQNSVNEGSAASALNVNSYTGNGVRGVLGVAAGSKAINAMTEKYTYRAYVGVGADSSGVLNPTMAASLAGMSTSINTPNAGATFVQAGLYATAKFADNAYAYAGLSGEARSGQTLGAVNVGLRVQF